MVTITATTQMITRVPQLGEMLEQRHLARVLVAGLLGRPDWLDL